MPSIPWRSVLQALTIIFVLVTIAWYIYEPGFDPAVTLLGGIITGIGSFFVPSGEPQQNRTSTIIIQRTESSKERESQQIPHVIPPPPADFTGRDAEIKELLEHFDRGAVIVGMRGLGGIGKTALAYRLAEKLQDRYPDGQLMVNLRGTYPKPLTPSEAMGHVIRAYNPDARLPENEPDLSAIYHTTLHNKRALLLLDNASDDIQVRPLLPPPPCSVLITSRKKFTLPGLKEKDLNTLNSTEAKDLLLAIAGRIGDHADELAKLCGYLPLALRAAGSLLANTYNLDPAEYIEELRAERTRLKGFGTEGVDQDVEANFNLSYDRLPEDTARVFRMLSVFPVDFDASAEEAVCEDEGHRHLSELVRWGLVDYRSLEGIGRYRLHDLARIFAANRLMADDACFDVHLRYAKYYKDVLSGANDLYKKGGENVLTGLKLFDLEWPNIQAGQAWAETIAREANTKKGSSEKKNALRLCSSYPLVGANVLSLRLHPRKQICWLETALDAVRKLKDRGNEGAILGNMGFAYENLSEYRKAIKFHEQSLAIAREIGNRRGEGSALGNLGIAYQILGEYRKAIKFHEQCLVVAREIGDRREEGNALSSLGIAYKNLGEYRKAIEFQEQALTIDREIEDRRGEGQDLGNIGLAYYRLGEYRKAIEFQEQALTIHREIRDRRGEGAILGNMGLAYENLDEYRKAIEFYEQHVAIAREIGDRLGEGNSLFNMSLALNRIEERAQAITCAKSALRIYEQIGSPTAKNVRRKLVDWQG